jgi:hypothetical protein
MISKTMNMVTFLRSKLPPELVTSDPLSPKKIVFQSQSQEAKFLRYLAAAKDPLSVVQKLPKGSASPEEIETLAAVWPAILQEVQAKVLEHAAQRTKPLPLQKRLGIAAFFPQNPGAVEPLLDGGRMARIAAASAQGNAGEQKPQKKPLAHPIGESLKSNLDRLH